MSLYIAHKREDGKTQSLAEHLRGVAEMAASFAAPFGAAEQAYRAGLLHDLGKYGKTSQYRMQHPDTTSPCDHSTAGAQRAFRLRDPFAAFAVAGHHTGLPDRGGKGAVNDGTLMGRMNRETEDARAFDEELPLPAGAAAPAWLTMGDAFAASFYTRMLYSCLVDADYLDTEAFMRGRPAERGMGEPLPVLLERLKAYTKAWRETPQGELNRERSRVLNACLAAGPEAPGWFTLTVPTGGGKTLSSLAFALEHAVRHGLRRVVYAAPYTGIIDQNAAVFRQVLGAENVLAHHSGVDISTMNREERDRWSLAAENWDAPVIVTTAVQLFESLFACRSSRCRKLHRLAQSVVILDEAQLLPLSYLEPCVRALMELTRHYGTTVVLCTATQPELGRLFASFDEKVSCRELCPTPETLAERLRRTYLAFDGACSLDALAARMAERTQALCILNRRADAQALTRLLPEEGRFHLSTMMTPSHRERTLGEIRRRLRAGLPCRVAATSLVECGVDVDFPAVFREEAGLDSILQAAGRCNREGKRPWRESAVSVFSLGREAPMSQRLRLSAFRQTMDVYPQTPDNLPAIRFYFSQLQKLAGDKLDEKRIVDACREMAFRTVGERLRLIEEETVPLYLQTEESRPLLDRLEEGNATRQTLRALGRFAVSVYPEQLMRLSKAGAARVIRDGEGQPLFAVLTDASMYSDAMGLAISSEKQE